CRCPRCEKQLPAAPRESLIQAALRGTFKWRPIHRERRDPLTEDLLSKEQIGVGSELSVRLTARVEERAVRRQARRRIVNSVADAEAEAAPLAKRLQRAQAELRTLGARKPRNRRMGAPETRSAAEQLLERHRLQELLWVTSTAQAVTPQVRRDQDRPARTETAAKIAISLRRDRNAINAVKEQLGGRGSATTHPSRSVGAAGLADREQFRIEDGIRRLTGRPLGWSPMDLQTEPRMVGLSHLLTIAWRVRTRIEFRVRRGLRAEGKPSTGLSAGQRGGQSARPSAEWLLKAFQGIDAVVGKVKEQLISYLRPWTTTQQRILSLWELDVQLYDMLMSDFQKSTFNVSER